MPWLEEQQLVSGLTASYYRIQLSSLQNAEIGHFQSRRSLWVSDRKLLLGTAEYAGEVNITIMFLLIRQC